MNMANIDEKNNQTTFLEVKDLTVYYTVAKVDTKAVNGVSFTLNRGETIGLVGETGAGKTTIAKAILGILPTPPARLIHGDIIFDGKNLTTAPEADMLKIRGDKISMIFQDPMTALNPVIKVGEQIAEVIELHNNCSKAEAKKSAERMLEMVGIPATRYGEYPHQFSGGMKQRVVIAMALACSPDLLLADEPTTALDVTIQAQVLDMISELQKKNNTAMILITHDLGVVAQTCDKVAVIYAGEVIESGNKEAIFDHPTHPYTIGLFGAIPKLDDDDEEWLHPVEGLPPDPTNLPDGCAFSPRCPYADDECRHGKINENEIAPGHFCRCIKRMKEA
jgi:peptide/nickel transport system ATP-binding protein